MCICGYLFYRWEVVPQRDFTIQIEHIKPEIDTVSQVACVINLSMPMTSSENLITKNSPVEIQSYTYEKKNINIGFPYISFITDSIRHGVNFDINGKFLYKKIDSIAIKSGLKEYPNLTNVYLENWSKPQIDSLFITQYGIDKLLKDEPIRYICIKQLCAYSGIWGDNSVNSNAPKYIRDSLGSSIFKYDIIDNEYLVASALGSKKYAFSTYTLKMNAEHHWYDWLNPLDPFLAGSPMEKPRWGRLEDISQAYVNIKLKSLTVDSILLNIDFFGATDFSEMDPKPDKITMSSVRFHDPAKIYKIRANGLKFHARFVELENFQYIRVFFVTAIMSSIFIILITFLILQYFKMSRAYKKRKIDKKKRDSKNGVDATNPEKSDIEEINERDNENSQDSQNEILNVNNENNNIESVSSQPSVPQE